MKAKYFAYRKQIDKKGEHSEFIYVIRPSALTFLAGECCFLRF